MTADFKQYFFNPALDDDFISFDNTRDLIASAGADEALLRKPYIVLHEHVGYGGRHWYTETGWSYVGGARNDIISGIKFGAGRATIGR